MNLTILLLVRSSSIIAPATGKQQGWNTYKDSKHVDLTTVMLWLAVSPFAIRRSSKLLSGSIVRISGGQTETPHFGRFRWTQPVGME